MALFLIAMALSLLTPVSKRLAGLIGAVDQPDARKIHRKPMPRLGGLAISSSFILTLLIAISLPGYSEYVWKFLGSQTAAILSGLLIIIGIGIYDDVKNLKPAIKFLFQFAAGLLVYLAGVRIEVILNPLGMNNINLGFLSLPVTLLWVVGITNAFNLIDDLDGLAGGVACIAAMSIFGVAFLGHNVPVAIPAVILAGCLVDFLKYNFYLASIFLGDSGSLFLRFVLSIISIKGAQKETTVVALATPLLALGLPIVDTFLAMVRRFLKSLQVTSEEPRIRNQEGRMERKETKTERKERGEGLGEA